MNHAAYLILSGTIIAAPLVCQAQPDGSLTRDEVRSQLVQVEATGYKPGTNDPDYPSALRAAEARVATQDRAAKNERSRPTPDGNNLAIRSN